MSSYNYKLTPIPIDENEFEEVTQKELDEYLQEHNFNNPMETKSEDSDEDK